MIENGISESIHYFCRQVWEYLSSILPCSVRSGYPSTRIVNSLWLWLLPLNLNAQIGSILESNFRITNSCTLKMKN